MEEHETSRHRFRLKGQEAEILVQDLAERSFMVDWCFPNPALPNGKELCDLLVVFDDVAIFWQIKNLKLRKDGTYDRKEVAKNTRQLAGAQRHCFGLKREIVLKNSRRQPEAMDVDVIKEVFLISVLAGPGEEIFPLADAVKDRAVHVFTRQFVEIVLNELDTINDFLAYLRAKQIMLQRLTAMFVEGGEEELLAYYLIHERSFSDVEKYNALHLSSGPWGKLQENPEYKKRQQENRYSYLWDAVIEQVHTGVNPQYERIAREMARPTRFERRYLSKVLLDARSTARKLTPDRIFRRVLPMTGRTYCFLLGDDPPPSERRSRELQMFCFVARGEYPENPMVIGVATDREMGPDATFNFCLLDIPDWTEEDEATRAEIQQKTGILTNVVLGEHREEEYPSS